MAKQKVLASNTLINGVHQSQENLKIEFPLNIFETIYVLEVYSLLFIAICDSFGLP